MQMIHKWLGVAATSLMGSFVPVRAQLQSHQPIPTVSFRYEIPSRDSGAPALMLIVHVEIAPGWHINSDAPLDEFLVPTRVDAKEEGREFGTPRYPRPERVHSAAMGGDMLLFSGAFDVNLPVLLKTASGKAGDSQNLPRTRVTLKYQACDQATCFPPKEVSVEH
jgi:DsbC/DsbD-like thiol-disulfide interchange protein